MTGAELERDPDERGAAEALPSSAAAPPIEAVWRYLTYGLSIPERALRSTTALVSGTLRESAQLLVPAAFQSSRTYETFVSQMLDFLARDVGRAAVGGAGEPEGAPVEQFVARKAVGNFIELAGLATLHVSPMTVLAVVSDLAYGSKAYLQELAVELKRQGVIAEDSTIGGVGDLLESIGRASGTTSQTLDTPPLNGAALKASLQQTVDALRAIDLRRVLPQAEVDALWRDMNSIAAREEVGILQISSAMTLYALQQVQAVGRGTFSSAQVAAQMLQRHVLDHYRQGLGRIAERGLYAVLAETSKPYLDAVWTNFSRQTPTVTEAVVSGRWLSRWGRWLCGGRQR